MRRSPEGVRRWQDRSRERARERERERSSRRARSGSTRPGGLSRKRAGRRKATLPRPLRVRVLSRTRGLCTVCLHREQIDPERFSIPALQRLVTTGRLRAAVQLHHILPEDEYRQFARVEDNLIGVCVDCHMAHEFSPNGRIRRAALPACSIEFAETVGLSWFIERHYPVA